MTSKQTTFMQEGRLLLPDLNSEHPLDTAMRTRDVALRCFFVEHGYKKTQQLFHTLNKKERASYERIPFIQHDAYPSGTFVVKLYDGGWQQIEPSQAKEHLLFAFCVRNN